MAHLTLEHLDGIIASSPRETGVPRVFVETGTLECHTTLIAAVRFPVVHTIDLSPEIYAAALDRCAGTAIQCHLGDSAEVLPELCAEYDEPVLFYLDAHHFWRGAGDLASVIAGGNPMPLIAELESIRHRAFADWIIVDDVHAFGRAPKEGTDEADWTEINTETIVATLGKSRIVSHQIIGDQLVIWRSHANQTE